MGWFHGKDYSKKFQNQNEAQHYEKGVYAPGSYYDLMWEMEKEFLKERINVIKKGQKKIEYLDFACGTGRVISYVEKFVDISVGVDIAKEMLKIAGKKLKKSKLVQRDIIENPLTGKYDLITSFRFFLNAEPKLRHRILDSLVKNMKPTTSFIFSIHGNTFSLRFIVFWLSRLFSNKLSQMSFYDVKEMLSDHNLEIVNYTSVGFLPKFLYKVKPLRRFLYKADRFLHTLKMCKPFSQILIFEVRKNA